MFTQSSRLAWLPVLIVAATLTGCGRSGKLKSYSAEQVQLDGEGNVKTTTKYYVAGDSVRTEMSAPGSEGRMIVILDRKAKLLRMLNPTDKRYFERQLEAEDLKKAYGVEVTEDNSSSVGKETINGFACDKREVESTISVMGFTRKIKSTVWVSDRLDIPIRIKGQTGETTELRNIEPGKQDASLFELPKDYEKADNMFAIFTQEREKDEDTAGDEAPGTPEEISEMLKKIKLPFGK